MEVRIRPHPRFPAIYTVALEGSTQRLASRNLTVGRGVYGEKRVRHEGVEYRLWDPFRSKLAAAIFNNLETLPIKPKNDVLYLGAASGTTASHVSDVIGQEGRLYCVEFAPRVLRELVTNVCAFRLNMFPLLEDARFPENYLKFVEERVDTIYCDIAQPEQAKVLADNADVFLKKAGSVMLAVKAQSIDVTKKPSEIFEKEIHVLKRRGFHIHETVDLAPYDKAHVMVVAEI